MFGITNPFGSKDKADDKKAESVMKPTPPTIRQGDLRVPVSGNAGSGSGQVATGLPQGSGATAQTVPQHQPPLKPPSITFDESSLEAIKSSFVRMANAFEELKRLNEEHKRIQESNLKLFSGEKDREIAELKKAIDGLNLVVEARDKEIRQKAQMLEDSTNDLNRLNKDLFEKSEEVRRRELEIVGVRKDIAAVNSSLEDEKSSHEALKVSHAALEESKRALETTKAELEATIADLNSQIQGERQTVVDLRKEMEDLRGIMSRRLAQFVPLGILESSIGPQVIAFDQAAADGGAAALRVIAGLCQLRAAFVPGAGPDDRLAAVKSIGSALYAAWSGQSKDAKSIHAHFAEWQDFLNNLPGAGYQLVVPDLGQAAPSNVTAPLGMAKVSEVQLWIIKGDGGAIYCRGIVR